VVEKQQAVVRELAVTPRRKTWPASTARNDRLPKQRLSLKKKGRGRRGPALRRLPPQNHNQSWPAPQPTALLRARHPGVDLEQLAGKLIVVEGADGLRARFDPN